MLKNNERRILAIVILGTAIVSLVTATVLGLIEAISMLADFPKIYGENWYSSLAGALTLIMTLLSAAFCICVLCVQDKRMYVGTRLCGAMCTFFVVTAIVLRSVLPRNGLGFTSFTTLYTLCQSFVTISVPLCICAVFVMISVYMLDRKKRADLDLDALLNGDPTQPQTPAQAEEAAVPSEAPADPVPPTTDAPTE